MFDQVVQFVRNTKQTFSLHSCCGHTGLSISCGETLVNIGIYEYSCEERGLELLQIVSVIIKVFHIHPNDIPINCYVNDNL